MTTTAAVGRESALPEAAEPKQPWLGWGSPVGLGIGLVCVGAFFVLIALGLYLLSSI